MRLPFDAHNHVHLGPSPPHRALVGRWHVHEAKKAALSGMAIMSTHPRDYARICEITNSLPAQIPGVHVVPGFGLHPWYVHELEDHHWETGKTARPKWLQELEDLVDSTPGAIVGEIGLDAVRYQPETGALSTPMDRQRAVFDAQMDMAARLNRPVSVHAVKCWGPMMSILSHRKQSKHGLPPSIYFHAFGGKVGTVDQLTAICGRGRGRVYFGFAPVINFRSPKTAEVIQKVGLDRLVLETDHEDASLVGEAMEMGTAFVAQALNESESTVIDWTTANAFQLYRL